MVAFSRLLAKSSATPEHPRAAEDLVGHTALVIASAEQLLRARGVASLEAVALDPVDHSERLTAIVRLAAFVHDLGKANDQFQRMVRRQLAAVQMLRHEAVSFWLCWPGQALASWLLPAVGADQDSYRLAVLAAVGHHRKFWQQSIAPEDSGAGVRMTALVSHADFRRVLAYAERHFDLATPPVLADIEIRDHRRDSVRSRFESWEKACRDWPRAGSPQAALLAVAKALVLSADVAGSALPRGRERPAWISRHLASRTRQTALMDVVGRRLQGRELRPFQRAVTEAAGPVTLVSAGCGTGKTIAAYLWAAQRHPSRQLWVTYPTTGTATEGFRDYIFGAEIEGRLEHSRAEVDLELFGLQDAKEEDQRELDRLNAIRAWGSDVVTCTVDTVLGLIQNQRKGLYAWPGLCDGAVVFDEVHAYDDALFGALLRFLEALRGVPVLMMTASLPESRRQRLREVVVRVHGVELVEIAGPGDLEALPRYVVRREHNPQLVWREVVACIRDGGQVLWVSNTVDRCIDIADQSHSRDIAEEPIIYHSRFRYVDRVDRHAAIIKAFATGHSALAATTQVAEMSLDLSADLLVTDLAPVPALIQRMGRLNRRSTPERPGQPRNCLVIDFAGPPYHRDDLATAERWLASLNGRPTSQSDLATAWASIGEDKSVPVAVRSEWLDGRFITEVAVVRQASPGLTVILPEDAAAVRSGHRRLTEVLLPMSPPPPPWRTWQAWPSESHVPIAPSEAIDYDLLRGARWRRQ